ncbi:MAG: hypothetical protein AB1352_01930 [Patescibacteria group bacterium]
MYITSFLYSCRGFSLPEAAWYLKSSWKGVDSVYNNEEARDSGDVCDEALV